MLWIDLETYSACPIKEAGAYRYADHPSTEILLVAWAVDADPVEVFDATQGGPWPTRLVEALKDCSRGERLICAHNGGQFDRLVLEANGWEIPLRQWRDSATKARSLGLPGALADLGRAIGLPRDIAKLDSGSRLINRFCAPAPANHKAERYGRATHPREWAEFVEYARRDVEAMRHLYQRLPDWNYRGSELDLWHLDQTINDRGLPVDRPTVGLTITLVEQTLAALNRELAGVTQGRVPTATAVGALTAWVRSRGVSVESLAAEDIAALLAGPLPDDVRRALEIRAQAGRSSTAKYARLVDATAEDGRLRGAFIFCGASRTGRWSGSLFQPQNLPRPTLGIDSACASIQAGTTDLLYDDMMEVAASAVRGMIQAPEGHRLVVSDLAGIEGRVLPWLCRFQGKLDQIAGGLDMYKVAASKIYDIPYERVNKDQRFIGKVAELALGYQGGVGALQQMARAYGVDIDPEQAQEIVTAWREANAPIRGFWWDLEREALAALRSPLDTFSAGRLLLNYDGAYLRIKLPSGRVLCYYQPVVYSRLMPWGETKDQISYLGVNQVTRQWEAINTYGGKLAENCTQAVARDILAANMPLVEQAGFRTIGTVHDEIICEVPESSTLGPEQLSALLATAPPWAPGLPLAAEGYSSKRYQK